ncbi:ABC transporter ATP-binding protein [Clavibacter sp. Sh2036]|uniref:ABC transporter ATP-binding protein n=1 Tax=Clavibacter sp. Sh2036 TaxID=3397677 RepID=UPI0039E16EEE
MNGAAIELEGATVRLGGRTVLDDLSATFEAGRISIVLGPSGSGKSTILRVLAGLQRLTSGHVRVADEPILGPSASRGLVFQQDGLLPWLNVRQNVELPLKIARVPKAQRTGRVAEMLAEVELSAHGDLLPGSLSGGMRQRAQIARTLVTRPSVLLLDEPFSALDIRTRAACQQLLLRVHDEHRPTVVFVTHDLEEADALGGRQLVLTGKPANGLVEIPDSPSRATETGTDANSAHVHRLKLLALFASETGASR